MNPEQPPVIGELFSVMNGSTASSATFVFGNEDHTLGTTTIILLHKHMYMQLQGIACLSTCISASEMTNYISICM